MPGASRSVLIQAPPDQVFAAIADYESYPQFLSEVKAARVVSRSAGQVDVQYELELIKRIRYTLRHQETPPSRISWSLVEGEVIRENQGHWDLQPEAGGTRATYSIEIAVGPLVPKALLTPLIEGSLPKMLEAFKRRAEAGKPSK